MRYFAYCTYLDESLLKQDFPSARQPARATLHGYKLVFVTYAERPDVGSCHLERLDSNDILGIIWEIDDSEFSREVTGYGKVQIRVQDETGQEHHVWTFVALAPLAYRRPGAEYFDHIIRGASRFGFPSAYIRGLWDLYSSLA